MVALVSRQLFTITMVASFWHAIAARRVSTSDATMAEDVAADADTSISPYTLMARGRCKFAPGEEPEPSNGTEVPMSVHDPRATVSKLGLRRGLAARLLQLGRAVIGHRTMSLELPGRQAAELVQAAFGIITARVPEACFAELRSLLTPDCGHPECGIYCAGRQSNRTQRNIFIPTLPRVCMELAKEAKKRYNVFARRMLPRSCVENGDKNPEGEQAAVRLHSLQRGFWEIYEPLTDVDTSTISVRAWDERRIKMNDRHLRQIWHYNKMHLLTITEDVLRHDLINAVAASEKKRLGRQMRELIHIQGMREARILHIELNAAGDTCASFPRIGEQLPDDALQTILEALKGPSAAFRSTIFYRERHWKPLGKNVARFVSSPLLTLKKSSSRKADEFYGSTNGHRVGMILKPILRAISIAGIVMGVATAGSTSFATLLAELIVGEGLAQMFASSSLLAFLVGKAVYMAADVLIIDPVVSQTISHVTALTKIQRLMWKMESEESGRAHKLIEAVQAELHDKVESLMQSPAVQDQIPESSVDATDDLDIEEEVRRHLEVIVFDGFVGEVVPMLEEAIRRIEQKKDPSYGWLHWSQWRLYRHSKPRKALKGLRIWNPDWKADRYSGYAHVDSADRKILGLGTRNITVTKEHAVHQSAKTPERKSTMKLSSALKRKLYVHDVKAYESSRSGWLLWHQWAEYRGAGSALALKGTKVRLNKGIYGCESSYFVCGEDIACEEPWDEQGKESDSKSCRGFTVIGTSWRVGHADRNIWLSSTDTSCSGTFDRSDSTFSLSAYMKACLEVKDAKAYTKFVSDSARREQERQWAGNETSRPIFRDTSSISEAVQTAMRCKGRNSIKTGAEEGNNVLISQLGHASEELADESSQDLDDAKEAPDEDEKAISKIIEDGFHEQTTCS